MAHLSNLDSYKLAIAGTGKLAKNLSRAFVQKHLQVNYIWGRNLLAAQQLAQESNADLIEDISQISEPCLLFICISDSAIPAFTQKFAMRQNLVMIQMSGNIPLPQIEGAKAKYGVFYPLMSFSEGYKISWPEIPVFLEANDDETKLLLEQMAQKFGNSYSYMDARKRKALHLAAVFANNFVNHNLAAAYYICQQNGIDFECLQPLVLQTIRKAFTTNPAKVQTGPALRNDIPVIQEHIQMLEFSEFFRKIYETSTQSIQNTNHKSDLC